MTTKKTKTPTAPTQLKVAIFTWNSSGIKISDNYVSTVSDPNKKISPDDPDYLANIVDQMTTNQPHILFYATQESVKPGDQLHSVSLPKAMSEIKDDNGKNVYTLLKRYRLIETGITTGKTRGGTTVGSLRGLRNSVYILTSMIPMVEAAEKEPRSNVGKDFQKSFLCEVKAGVNYGGLASYVHLDSGIILAFINCHLPHDVESMKSSEFTMDYIRRRNAVMRSNICFNNVVRELGMAVAGKGSTYYPDFVFVAGGLNYQVSPEDAVLKKNGILTTEYNTESWDDPQFLTRYYKAIFLYDELNREMDNGNLYPMLEGTAGTKAGHPQYRLSNGDLTGEFDTKNVVTDPPYYPPSCEFKTKEPHRKPGSPATCDDSKCKTNYDIKNGNRMPSWCDRILYMQNKKEGKMKCTLYEGIDDGNTIYSAHMPIMGRYDISTV